MGKAAILIITASVLLGSVYAYGAKDEANAADERLSTHQREILSRNAALAGYNLAKQALAENFDTATPSLSGTYAGSDYDVTISKSGAIARVVSTGTSLDPKGNEVTFTVEADIEKEVITEIADEAPPFMRYAVMTDDDLYLNGNILFDLFVDGNAENTLNANMHTNGDLGINGNAATVRGFGTYADAAWSSPSSALYNTFDPYYNPTDDPVVQRVPEVEIPAFDLATFLSKTTVDQTTTGNLSLSGTYSLGGTRENPYVWYVDGNVSGSGGVTIDGYVMFIVNGDVTLSGNLMAGNVVQEGDESSIALYASGDVEMGGNSKIYGQIYAGSSVSVFHGTPRIYGNIASKGSVTLSGTPKVYYRVPSPALTTIFEDPQVQLKLVSYSEW